MYIPRFNRLFIAVRVVKLYTHAVYCATPAQKGAVQILPVQKKIMISPLKMDGRADGNRKKERLPLCFVYSPRLVNHTCYDMLQTCSTSKGHRAFKSFHTESSVFSVTNRIPLKYWTYVSKLSMLFASKNAVISLTKIVVDEIQYFYGDEIVHNALWSP